MDKRLQTMLLTGAALLAFAWNSILTRMALGAGQIDAATFAAVRLGAGALMLVVLVCGTGSWRSSLTSLRGPTVAGAVALFAYAVPFSFAYERIGAAVGALVLFGAVQVTMIAWGLACGERLGLRTWLGLALAAAGLGFLMLPAAHKPDPVGVLLMVVAGMAWAAYSLLGKRAADALAANARAFAGCAPAAIALALVVGHPSAATGRGLALAAISGALTSAIGYAIWYRALRGLSATQAAVVQLSVPVIAALTAAVVLDERVSSRLVIATVIVVGGVALVLVPGPPRVAKP